VFDHVIVDVSDLQASRRFYELALAPLDISVVMEFPDRFAFGGKSGKPQFWGRGSRDAGRNRHPRGL
jgi:catechol 2,3-dioxygenase-like lactoylglutathione lyase family enzyme